MEAAYPCFNISLLENKGLVNTQQLKGLVNILLCILVMMHSDAEHDPAFYYAGTRGNYSKKECKLMIIYAQLDVFFDYLSRVWRVVIVVSCLAPEKLSL